MHNIEKLHQLLNKWYLSKGYNNKKDAWFETQLISETRIKAIKITDLTGNTPSRRYTFIDVDTQDTLDKAMNYFNKQLELTEQDLREISDIIDTNMK